MVNKHFSNVVFYFDQQNAVAEVIEVDNNKITVVYFNKVEDLKKEFTFSLSNKKKLDSIYIGKKIEMLYSKRYNKVCVIGFTPRPSIMPIFLLIMAAIPIVFYSTLEENLRRKKR